MFSLVSGLHNAASLHVGNLLGLFLVLFRMTVRALIREDASTESGLLPDRCTESFTKGRRVGGNQSATAVCGLGQGIFFFSQYLLQAI